MRVLADLQAAHSVAETMGKRGIVNFLEDRIDTHEKHSWMLRSFTKGE
jgi:DNA-binding ferritin-like protein